MIQLNVLCVETSTASGIHKYDEAMKSCFDIGRRLCSPYELITYCQESGNNDFKNSNWEWTSNAYGTDNATLALGNASNCLDLLKEDFITATSQKFRCCSGLVASTQ
jgi:hypothetical protein